MIKKTLLIIVSICFLAAPGYSMPWFFHGKAASDVVPKNLIIPFDADTGLPDGWDWYNDANDYFVIGKGTANPTRKATVAEAFTGVNSISKDDHPAFMTDMSGIQNKDDDCPQAGGSVNLTSAAHTHPVEVSNISPAKIALRFIKANKPLDFFPANGIILSNIDFAPDGLTNIYYNGYYYLEAASAKGTPTAADTAAVVALTSYGAHNHTTSGTGFNWYAHSGSVTVAYYFKYSNGAHTHSGTATVAMNLKRYYLSAWKKASAKFPVRKKMIGMWDESDTVPAGWKICDGTNGTPDLKDCFISLTHPDDTGIHGTGAGDNTATVNISGSSASPGHSHNGSYHQLDSSIGFEVCGLYGHAENSSTWTHNHDGAGSTSGNYQPKKYTLIFIMKK